MGGSLRSLIALAALVNGGLATATERSPVRFDGPLEVEAGGMANIHVTYTAPIDGEFSVYYGDCALDSLDQAHHRVGSTHIGRHPLAARHLDWEDQRPSRFVWLPPSDIPDQSCLHAFLDGMHVAKSQKCSVKKRKVRRGTFGSVADPTGPWFDGVEHLQQKEPDQVFVASVKSKKFGILGGGMSGLMTAFLFESVGIHDWQILEASQRIGGRVHTTYLNNTRPDQYQYQEMGPMRFPVNITNFETNETLTIQDHKMVFQLADALNAMNGNGSEFTVNFIPWIQASSNDPVATSHRRPDGTVPGAAEVSANPSLADNVTATFSNVTAVEEAEAQYSQFINLDDDKIRLFATNVFEAHKQAIADGNMDFSEAQFLRYGLHKSLNITDEIDSITDFDPSWEYDTVYHLATQWLTIDQGLTRLPTAFSPLVLNRTHFNRTIESLAFNASTKKVTVGWRPSNLLAQDPVTEDFDFVTVAIPFSRVRLWKLPNFSSLLSRAILRLNYAQACKVAILYKTRWWEHLERPIIGGCGITNILWLGNICYPSYKINSTGPGALLASYITLQPARSVGSLTDEEHVALVQRAMVDVHGEIAAEQFTGIFDRICWENNEFQAGAWADPTSGQHELYIPAFYQTELNTVFVGEHTSYTHAWIWSALESAVRGSTQMLLDLGLVDEAKQIMNTWMARWINL